VEKREETEAEEEARVFERLKRMSSQDEQPDTE
jgi:hypothetical protein